MKKNHSSKSAFFQPRFLLALCLCSAGALFALIAFAMPVTSGTPHSVLGTAMTWNGNASTKNGAGPTVNTNPIVAVWQLLAAYDVTRIPPRMLLKRASGNSRVAPAQGAPNLTPVVSAAVSATLSPNLRDLPAANQFSAWVQRPEERPVPSRFPNLPRNPLEADPVIQPNAPTAGMPPIGVSFDAMTITQACGSCLPPDTNGAVGPNHYVQMVNSSVAVYSKTGTTLVAPKAINQLWASTPSSECFTHNNGDPIVLYDQLADRWLVSQFAIQAASENYAQCIAISQTPDPTGAYYLYEFDESAAVFHDYPHLGVWPDGYYMSTNQFPNDATASVAAGAWVFERPAMLLGQSARSVFFDETPLVTNTYTPFGQLPSSLDGRTLPPAGAPNYFAEVDDVNQPNTPPAVGLHDEIRIWKFHVDWTNPANSTFGTGSSAPAPKAGFSGQFAGNAGQPNFIIPIADFLASACQIENGPNDCVPEKQTSGQPPQYLDILGDRLMFRLAYRNFGDHESLVVNHSVDALDTSAGTARTGVRWYEIRNPSTTPTVFQQGTFAPLNPMSTDGPLWRWMGSAAMDHSGNIAVGYSASGPNYFPSLHYAGRLANDPLNELSQGEAVMFLGQGIEANTGIFPFRNRWGDYSALTVDPNDDCTFWYTTEYMVSGPTDILPVDWRTRVASFRFPTCVAPAPQLTAAVSRKTHGLVGTFDIDLPLTGTAGVESRTGGVSGNHKIVFTFLNTLTSVGGVTVAGTSGNPMSVPGGDSGINPSDSHQYIVNLTGVDNAQYITITLTNVHDTVGNVGDVSVPMGVLLADVNASKRVDSGDVFLVRQQSLQDANTANFREDVNASGRIDSGDVFIARQQSLTALP